MCFSAAASFGVGAALLPVGVYCVRLAVRKDRAYLPLAATPLLFGIQQFCEGLVWLGLERGRHGLVTSAALSYLFFAIAFWLIWVPLSFLSIEPRKHARGLRVLIAAAGLVYGASLYVPMLLDPGARLSVSVDYHSVQYGCRSLELFRVLPEAAWLTLYMAIVFAPMMISGHRQFRLLSVHLAVAAGISHAFFWYAFVSVWCFFAAILSIQIAYILRKLLEPTVLVPARAAR